MRFTRNPHLQNDFVCSCYVLCHQDKYTRLSSLHCPFRSSVYTVIDSCPCMCDSRGAYLCLLWGSNCDVSLVLRWPLSEKNLPTVWDLNVGRASNNTSDHAEANSSSAAKRIRLSLSKVRKLCDCQGTASQSPPFLPHPVRLNIKFTEWWSAISSTARFDLLEKGAEFRKYPMSSVLFLSLHSRTYICTSHA